MAHISMSTLKTFPQVKKTGVFALAIKTMNLRRHSGPNVYQGHWITASIKRVLWNVFYKK